MKLFSVEKIFCTKYFNFWLLFPALLLILNTGCAQNDPVAEANAIRADKYRTDSLAKDWRNQVRVRPQNPYEQYGYHDNDEDYRAPIKRKVPRKYDIPVYEDNDSGYGRYPRYNPDDDNTYLNPQRYPLYMDY